MTLDDLLNYADDPSRFSQLLFEETLRQAEQESPELAEVFLACALPARFEQATVAVVRGLPLDDPTHADLFTRLLDYSFIQPVGASDQFYSYHDDTRAQILVHWQQPAQRETLLTVCDRLLQHYLAQGQAKFDRKQYDDTRPPLMTALGLNAWLTDHQLNDDRLTPTLATLYARRGQSYLRSGDYDRARPDLEQAIALGFHSDEADVMAELYWDLGITYYHTVDYVASLDAFNKILSDNSTTYNNQNSIAHNQDNRSIRYTDLDQHLQAIDNYEHAIRLTPEFKKIYYNRGVCYAKLDQYLKAIEDFDIAIRLTPNYAKAYYNRGVCYAKLDHHLKAIDDFDIAISLNPDDATFYYSRGHSYAEQNLHSRAIEEYDIAIRLKPDPESYGYRGLSYHHLQMYRQAVENYDYAIQLNPYYTKVFYNKGCAHSLMGQVEPALAALRQALKLEVQSGSKRRIGLAQTDPDFDPIRAEAGFRALLAEFGGTTTNEEDSE